MRRLVAAAFVSLDGVMQAPGGPEEDPTEDFALGGWTAPFWDEETTPFDDVFSQSYDLLLGRKTYDIFAGYWPRPPNDQTPIGEAFNRVTKYVVTSSPDTLQWANSVAIGGDVIGRIRTLKEGDGPMLLTQGSSVLLHALLAHDLIDELRLMIFPVVLGTGKRWFGAGSHPSAFALERRHTSRTGVVTGVYRRNGDIQTGSF